MTNATTVNAYTNVLYKRYHSGTDPNMPNHYYEYYTPAHIIDAVQEVLGEIDLAPCSNSHTNPNVPAKFLYTKADNGLQYIWYDKVFMNPPYGYAITEWIEKLKHDYEKGTVTEAIALCPMSIGSQWFDRMRNYPCCFLQKNLHFLRPKGFRAKEAKGATTIFYFGQDEERFRKVFSRFGEVYQCITSYMGSRK